MQKKRLREIVHGNEEHNPKRLETTRVFYDSEISNGFYSKGPGQHDPLVNGKEVWPKTQFLIVSKKGRPSDHNETTSAPFLSM